MADKLLPLAGDYPFCCLKRDVTIFRDIRPSGMLILWDTDSRNIFLILFSFPPSPRMIAHLSSQIHSPLDPATKQRKGLAYITFAQPSNALAAYEALDRRSFQGRLLHILAAVDRRNKSEVVEGEGQKKSLKDEKNAKRKANASKEFNWSMLYMNVCTLCHQFHNVLDDGFLFP